MAYFRLQLSQRELKAPVPFIYPGSVFRHRLLRLPAAFCCSLLLLSNDRTKRAQPMDDSPISNLNIRMLNYRSVVMSKTI
jgi:hypothetical protein